jgi:NAD(P)H-dependent flavin oxidoreductase YrpB (nitropropane dioxygenase family)
MFHTRITKLFGVKYPIIQGGMHWLGKAKLTAAVAEAGGMAFMTALTHETPEKLREEIKKTRDLTDKPFGINMTLSRFLKRENTTDFLQVCVDEGIKVIETAANTPKEYMPMLKNAGILVVHKCTSLKHALHAENIGCDVVSIDGFECAGMPGEFEVTSLILVPLVSSRLKIPVVASGGFGDARGIVAALALGAEGVNMGTRFVMTQECETHDRVKQAMLEATENDTHLIMRTMRHAERCLRTEATEKVLEIEARGNATFDDIKHLIVGTSKNVTIKGDLGGGFISAGEVVGLINDIPTVKELFERMISEAIEIVNNRLPSMVTAT